MLFFFGGEGASRAEKQECQLATLGIKGLTRLRIRPQIDGNRREINETTA